VQNPRRSMIPFRYAVRLVSVLILIQWCAEVPASAERRVLPGHLRSTPPDLKPKGRLAADARLELSIGVPVRDSACLLQFLQDVYDPASPSYHQFLTAEEFDSRFGPDPQDYAKAIAFSQTNGFHVTSYDVSRHILKVSAVASDLERAFQIELRTYPHPSEARDFYAPHIEPSVPTDVPILDISGLNNFALPRPKNIHARAVLPGVDPKPKLGSGPNGLFMGNDFRNAYVPGVAATGTGQILGLLEFDGYYAADIASYETRAGVAQVPLQKVLLDGFNGTPTTGQNSGNTEVALDIELAAAMAPGLSRIIVYETGPNGVANDILSAMATNTAMKQIGCSWDFGSNPTATADQLF